MRIFLLGATGLIGRSVASKLLKDGHSLVALARSKETQEGLRQKNIASIRGDIAEPEKWGQCLGTFDAIIHMAAVFSDEMRAIDNRLTDEIIRQTVRSQHRIRVVYTGGSWLYGNTGSHVATERTAYSAIPAFQWMVEGERKLKAVTHLDTMIIHPGSVYTSSTGVFADFIAAAKAGQRITLWGDEVAYGPLVHAKDLADAYSRVLLHGQPGENYNAAAQDRVDALQIANRICEKYGSPNQHLVCTRDDVITQHGSWAEGLTLRQSMSSAKIRSRLGWLPKHSSFIDQI